MNVILCVTRLRMLQAQRQRRTAQKSAMQTPVSSTPASVAPSEDGTTPQNGMTTDTSSTHLVPDTDADSDIDMTARQASVTTASHDSDTEVRSYTTLCICCLYNSLHDENKVIMHNKSRPDNVCGHY